MGSAPIESGSSAPAVTAQVKQTLSKNRTRWCQSCVWPPSLHPAARPAQLRCSQAHPTGGDTPRSPPRPGLLSSSCTWILSQGTVSKTPCNLICVSLGLSSEHPMASQPGIGAGSRCTAGCSRPNPPGGRWLKPTREHLAEGAGAAVGGRRRNPRARQVLSVHPTHTHTHTQSPGNGRVAPLEPRALKTAPRAIPEVPTPAERPSLQGRSQAHHCPLPPVGGGGGQWEEESPSVDAFGSP